LRDELEENLQIGAYLLANSVSMREASIALGKNEHYLSVAKQREKRDNELSFTARAKAAKKAMELLENVTAKAVPGQRDREIIREGLRL
jgi:hypothetical protein